MTPDTLFQSIYTIDLVYAPGCWQLCGNAHCCNFSRYKSQMKIIGGTQVLLLLPGEYEYLQQTGALAQFGACDHRRVDYPLADGVMKIGWIAVKAGACPCQHDIRPTICRLYPLLPIFDIDGRLTGIDPRFTIYEEIEHAEGMERACKVENPPPAEMDKFTAMANAIGSEPRALFYMMAYRLVKSHASEQYRAAREVDKAKPKPLGPWPLFETLFVLKKL